MVSVILVTYNSINVLPDCMASLEQCSAPEELEIVFVDNYSSDETWEWIERYHECSHVVFAKILKLRLVENKGYAFANNRGVDLASGEIVLLLNPDTIIGHEAIEVCKEKLVNNRYGAIGCRLELGNGKLDKACRRSFPTLWNSFGRFSRLSILFPRLRIFASYNLTYLDDRDSYLVDCLCGAFLMISREIYVGIGELDEDYFMYGEDVDLCYRIKLAGYAILYEGTQTTIHLKGGNGGKSSISSLRHFYNAIIIYYKKHHAREHTSILLNSIRLTIAVMYFIHLIFNRFKPNKNNNLKSDVRS